MLKESGNFETCNSINLNICFMGEKVLRSILPHAVTQSLCSIVPHTISQSLCNIVHAVQYDNTIIVF
jgi:hypothetical protein